MSQLCIVLAGSRLGRLQKVASRSESKVGDQLLIGTSVRPAVAVTGNKLQISQSVCVTLVKGSLVQQKVSLSYL